MGLRRVFRAIETACSERFSSRTHLIDATGSSYSRTTSWRFARARRPSRIGVARVSDSRRPAQSADSMRLKSSGVILRREFVARDP
jgi:hypothetical protein